MTVESLHADVTSRIIDAAIEVHRILGPGFLESIYEAALAHEFDLRGIPYQRQITFQVGYKAIIAGEHRLDFLVEDKVVLDLKAVKDFEEIHTVKTLSYMRATKKRVGLLVNFNKARLVDGVKRLQI
ncbi:MAG: GxxExxY protein [Chloroflexota bacterium]